MKIHGKSLHTSSLSSHVTAEVFEKSYRKFMEQAEKNAVSKKAHGKRIPYGLNDRTEFDGGDFVQHFGQGSASKTPYLNWWVVSVYYIIGSRIVIGIEENRFPHLGKMTPIKYEMIGNKKERIAVFYETPVENIDFRKLYESFINVSEEVMQLNRLAGHKDRDLLL